MLVFLHRIFFYSICIQNQQRKKCNVLLLLLLLLLLIYLNESSENSDEYSCDFCQHNPGGFFKDKIHEAGCKTTVSNKIAPLGFTRYIPEKNQTGIENIKFPGVLKK